MFMGVITGIFLPVRLVFWTYVSHTWGTNLGVMTIIAVVFFLLFRMGKLGIIGRIFQKQIIRLTTDNRIKYFVGLTCYNAFWVFAVLYLCDYAEAHTEDIKTLDAFTGSYSGIMINFDNRNHKNISILTPVPFEDQAFASLSEPEMKGIWMIKHAFQIPLILGSEIVSHLNTNYTKNYGTHFAAVSLLGEIESLWLFFMYRKFYRSNIPRGESWEKLGIYPKTIQKFAYRYPKKFKNKRFI